MGYPAKYALDARGDAASRRTEPCRARPYSPNDQPFRRSLQRTTPASRSPSIVLAFVLALIIKSRSVGIAILIGTLFGPIIHVVNFYGVTAAFRWFAKARHGISVFSHGHSAHRVH
jgi:hypothetical protein